MSRYVAIPARALTVGTPNEMYDRGPMITAPSVDGANHVNTGLVDVHGNAIMRLPDPIGFHAV